MAQQAEHIDKVLGNTATQVCIREIVETEDSAAWHTLGTCLDTPNAIKAELTKPEYQGHSVWLFNAFGEKRYWGVVNDGLIDAATQIIEEYRAQRNALPVQDAKYSGLCDLNRRTALALIKVVEAKRDSLTQGQCVGCGKATHHHVSYATYSFYICRHCQAEGDGLKQWQGEYC